MMFTNTKIAALSMLAVQASAKTIKIAVGKDGQVFTPDSVTAAKGDILEYHFYKQHSVAMADFASPCAPAAQGGFFSGVMKVSGSGASKDVFQVTVNSTDPMAFYCTVASHCANGMVGVVNPSSTDSLDKLKSGAKNAQTKAPPAVFGGQMVQSSGDSTNTAGSPTQTDSTGTTTASGAQTSKTGAASQLHASLGGIGAAALGFAAMLM